MDKTSSLFPNSFHSTLQLEKGSPKIVAAAFPLLVPSRKNLLMEARKVERLL